MTIPKIIAAEICFGLTLFSGLAQVYAQTPAQSITVSPALLPIQLSPGKTIKNTITISNNTEIALPLQISVTNLETDEDREYAIAQTTPVLATWMHITPENLIIDGKSSRLVDITITVPTQVSVGGYYALLTLTSLAKVTNPDKPIIIPSVAIPIFATLGVDERLQAGEIQSFHIDKYITQSKYINTAFHIKNTGLSHFSAKPRITFSPIIGHDTYRVELTEKVILPGKSRSWNERISVPSTPNVYRLELAVSTGGGQWIRTHTYFGTLPIRELLMISIILFVIIIFRVGRKNLRRAWKELFR